MKFSPAKEVEDQRFRKHPKTSLLERGTLRPEQLREPREFIRAASLARLCSAAHCQVQRRAVQGSQGENADPSQKSKFPGNAVNTLNYPRSKHILLSGTPDSKTR